MIQTKTTNPVLAMTSSGESAYANGTGDALPVGRQCGTGNMGERTGYVAFTGRPAVRSVSAGAA